VTVTPVTSGDLDGAEYNYVWSYEGGWDLWGSTVKDEGKGDEQRPPAPSPSTAPAATWSTST
jgi:hypothetical protein